MVNVDPDDVTILVRLELGDLGGGPDQRRDRALKANLGVGRCVPGARVIRNEMETATGPVVSIDLVGAVETPLQDIEDSRAPVGVSIGDPGA